MLSVKEIEQFIERTTGCGCTVSVYSQTDIMPHNNPRGILVTQNRVLYYGELRFNDQTSPAVRATNDFSCNLYTPFDNVNYAYPPSTFRYLYRRYSNQMDFDFANYLGFFSHIQLGGNGFGHCNFDGYKITLFSENSLS